MKILVTGGAGFIGSNFIHYLLHKHPDWHIVNLDKLTYAGNLGNLSDIQDDPRYTFVHGDIADLELVHKLFAREHFDLVAHLAAESHVDRSILDASPFIETNVKGTQVLLEAAKEYSVRKFLQVSTDEVYGSLTPNDPAFTEESTLRPNSPYSASKAAADLLARTYFVTFGVPVVTTRCSNNYGHYQHPEKFIPTVILNAMGDKPIPVYGDGLNVRDWIHVKDHCRALDLALQKGEAGQVYNIGAANEHCNLDIVRAILKIMEKPETLITFVQDRPGHDRRYAINPAHTEDTLSWYPKVDFTTGLKDLIAWYTANRPWWERVKSGEYREYAANWYGDLIS